MTNRRNTPPSRPSIETPRLPRQGSNLDFPDPESGVLPITPRGTNQSGRRGSNPRPSAWEADALPTELLPRVDQTVLPPPREPSIFRPDLGTSRPRSYPRMRECRRKSCGVPSESRCLSREVPEANRTRQPRPEPPVRFELTTARLRIECSTPELRWHDGAEGNRTPDLCSAIAALSQLSYGPESAFHFPSMGGTRLELVTSTMSTWRSNQLS